MKRKGKKEKVTSTVVDIFFMIAVWVCCIVMVWALVCFIIHCRNSSNTIDRLIGNYHRFAVVTTGGETVQDSAESQKYMENLLNFAARLQEIESNSASSNMITFIFTFLSGALIGIASYFAKKSADMVNRIQANKEWLTSLESRTLFSHLFMYAQRAHFTIQFFMLSLNAIQDQETLEKFSNSNVPKINEVLNEMSTFIKINAGNLKELDFSERQQIREEINKAGAAIQEIPISADGPQLMQSGTKEGWLRQIDEIRMGLKS